MIDAVDVVDTQTAQQKATSIPSVDRSGIYVTAVTVAFASVVLICTLGVVYKRRMNRADQLSQFYTSEMQVAVPIDNKTHEVSAFEVDTKQKCTYTPQKNPIKSALSRSINSGTSSASNPDLACGASSASRTRFVDEKLSAEVGKESSLEGGIEMNPQDEQV